METPCIYCGDREDISQCRKCDDAWLCPTHEEPHCGRDPSECAPFKVEQDEKSGRYLVATRDIEKGSVILRDQASVLGPMITKTKLACLNCLATEGLRPCSRCKWPVCSSECEDGMWHLMECAVLSQSETDPNISYDKETFHLYPCVVPLRLLLLRKNNPSAWRVIDTFMDHNDQRDQDSQAWKLHELLVRNFVQRYLNLTFSDDEVRRAIGIIRTNSVKLEQPKVGGEGVAIFPTYSYANHQCQCNTFTRKVGHSLELVAQVDIRRGEEVSTRYTTPQLGSHQRVLDIQKTWHFVCQCPRCLDPTEFGSMMSAVKCELCEAGYLLPRLPTVIGSPWRCDGCGKVVGVSLVQSKLKGVLDVIAENRQEDNQSLLKVISLLEKSLHPNHYLILGIKEIIIQRLMQSINASKSKKVLDENFIEDLRLRTEIFSHVANVLKMVDSKGTNWEQRLESFQIEEKETILRISSQG